MGKLVQPKTYLVGYTNINSDGLLEYLKDTGNDDFIESWRQAKALGISDGEILCSFYAKLCYKALSLGKNLNVTRVRDIHDNVMNCFAQGHGSVFEHAEVNFVTTNCSRVLTHELVRHRIGTAFSQTSGRYVRLESIDFVMDPLLEPVKDLIETYLLSTENMVYQLECRLGLRASPEDHEGCNPDEFHWVPNDKMPFDQKKKLTSAIRRIAPNGQANEIGWSANFRALRHIVHMRTAGGAEREIRLIFGQVYDLIQDRFPLLFADAKTREVDGLLEVYGMTMQPYENKV